MLTFSFRHMKTIFRIPKTPRLRDAVEVGGRIRKGIPKLELVELGQLQPRPDYGQVAGSKNG